MSNHFFGPTDVVLCINNEPRVSQWGRIEESRVDYDLILLAFPVLGLETWCREKQVDLQGLDGDVIYKTPLNQSTNNASSGPGLSTKGIC